MATPHSYRGYTIRKSDGLGSPYAFEHDSFDGPGDIRYGYGDDLADCMGLIDDQIADRMAATGRARMAEGL